VIERPHSKVKLGDRETINEDKSTELNVKTAVFSHSLVAARTGTTNSAVAAT
jgi:hypothetical protein